MSSSIFQRISHNFEVKDVSKRVASTFWILTTHGNYVVDDVFGPEITGVISVLRKKKEIFFIFS